MSILYLVIPTAWGWAAPADAPSAFENRLPARAGWNASLIFDNNETGIWTVGAFDLFEQYGCPEVVGLDDEGRCQVLIGYSGKWTSMDIVHDMSWLGGLAHADVDPRVPGKELYVGGRRGHLYQVIPYPQGALDCRLIASFPGLEIHTLAAGDLDPVESGSELLVFTNPGHLIEVTPNGEHGAFKTKHLQSLTGRVRDAVILPACEEGISPIATVSRAGKVELLQLRNDGPQWQVLYQTEMGLGRLAVRPCWPGHPTVLYSTTDDGRVLRHEKQSDDQWKTEAIFLGSQGLRGIAAGRFSEDPERETVAIFGYDRKVRLLTRQEKGAWKVEVLFEDRDKGHWLSFAELDGRNATREIIGSGYGGRIFMLTRPPGYGLTEVATDAELEPENMESPDKEARPVRVAVRAGLPALERLSPLSYRGGFQTTTLIYETLVKRDSEGRIAPGLASAWRFEDRGRTAIFTLREGARFHDGTLVDAEAVRMHFKRWLGLPEHDWLEANERIKEVVASSPNEVRIVLDQPYALLPDLCAINPCAVRGPGALDREGEFVGPMGSGPFRFVESLEGGRVLRYEFLGPGGAPDAKFITDLKAFGSKELFEPTEALLDGEVDVLVDGWHEVVPRYLIAGLAADTHFDVIEGCGSSVWYLSFRLDGGPTADSRVRRRIASAISRTKIIEAVEWGYADPCFAWAAPTVRIWPDGTGTEPEEGPLSTAVSLRIVVHSGSEREEALGWVVAEQLDKAGMKTEVEIVEEDLYEQVLEKGDYDLRFERTWGVPYDPELSLKARFLPSKQTPSAATNRFFGIDPRISRLVEEMSRLPDESDRIAVFRKIQQLMDQEALIVPLFVPRRVAVIRKGFGKVNLDHDLYRTDLTTLSK
ncbi:MAG: ABC transporter substrate-binding protein [Planctomycetota bacterium]